MLQAIQRRALEIMVSAYQLGHRVINFSIRCLKFTPKMFLFPFTETYALVFAQARGHGESSHITSAPKINWSSHFWARCIMWSHEYPLHRAVEMNRPDLVAAMLDKGADIHLIYYGHNVLEWAAYKILPDVTYLLTARLPNIATMHISDWHPLNIAISHGWEKTAALMLDRGVSANSVEPASGNSALMVAIWVNNITFAERLISLGAELQPINLMDNRILEYALELRRQEIAIHIIEIMNDYEAKNRDGRTVLHQAIYQGNPQVVAWLLKKGVSLEERDAHGRTPLQAACFFRQFKCVLNLLKAGANINAVTENYKQETAMHIAAQREFPDIIKVLLSHGCDKSLTNSRGRSASEVLQARNGAKLAVRQWEDDNKERVREALLFKQITGLGPTGVALNADVVGLISAYNKPAYRGSGLKASGVMAADFAAERILAFRRQNNTERTVLAPTTPPSPQQQESQQQLSIFAHVLAKTMCLFPKPWRIELRLHRLDVLYYLAEQGYKENIVSDIKVLRKAIKSGNTRLIRYLAKNGANLNCKMDTHPQALVTPLIKAIKKGGPNSLGVVKALVESGADLELNSPLNTALTYGMVEIAIYLIEQGANIRRVNFGSIAIGFGHNQTVMHALIQHGADVDCVFDGLPLLRQAIILKKPACRLLIAHGASTEAANRNSSSALDSAIYVRDVQLIRELYNADADLNAPGFDGLPPLHCAIRKSGCSDIIELLLELGSDPETRYMGLTALQYAISLERMDYIRILIPHANLAAVTHDMRHSTPLHMALEASKRGRNIVHDRWRKPLREILQRSNTIDVPDSNNKTPRDHIAAHRALSTQYKNYLREPVKQFYTVADTECDIAGDERLTSAKMQSGH